MVIDSTKHRLALKRILYHPLTWVALGAHIVLLVVPFNPMGPDAAPEAAKDEQLDEVESIPVDILNLSEIATSKAPPEKVLVPPPPSSPAPTIARSVQPDPVAPALIEPATVNTESEDQTKTIPTSNSIAAQQTIEDQSPAYDPEADQRQFIQNLEGLGLGGYKINGKISLPDANSFRKGVDPSYFITETGVRPNTVISPVEGAREARWLDKEPTAVLSKLTSTYSAAGISFAQVENYGGEALYELTTADGDSFIYLSLVQLKGSTLLVVWQSDPRMQSP